VTSKRQRGLTEHVADAAIDSACRLLRLPTIRSQFYAGVVRLFGERMGSDYRWALTLPQPLPAVGLVRTGGAAHIPADAVVAENAVRPAQAVSRSCDGPGLSPARSMPITTR